MTAPPAFAEAKLPPIDRGGFASPLLSATQMSPASMLPLAESHDAWIALNPEGDSMSALCTEVCVLLCRPQSL